jgi:hypothetical protein
MTLPFRQSVLIEVCVRPEEKEQLVRLITQEILLRLRVSVPAQTAGIVPMALPHKSVSMINRLITLNDVKSLAEQDVKIVIVAERAIVTAAALDYLKERHMSIQRGAISDVPVLNSADSKGVVAILAPGLYQIQWQAIQKAVLQSEHSPERVATGVNQKLVDSIPEFLQRVASGRYLCGIILEENAPSLLSSFRRHEKIRPVVGWDLASVKLNPAPRASNVLLINHRLYGSKKMSQLIKAWLVDVT